VQFYERLDDGQSETGAAVGAGISALSLPERFHHRCQMFFGDAGTIIMHDYIDALLLTFNVDSYGPSLSPELHRIHKEVSENLPQSSFVRAHQDVSVGPVELNRAPDRCRTGIHGLYGLIHDVSNEHRRLIECDSAGFEARQIENIREDGKPMSSAVGDD
jgi:hypothetical protein